MFIKRLETHAATMVRLARIVLSICGHRLFTLHSRKLLHRTNYQQASVPSPHQRPTAAVKRLSPAQQQEPPVHLPAGQYPPSVKRSAFSTLSLKVPLGLMYGFKYVLISLPCPLDNFERNAIQYRTYSLGFHPRPTTSPKLHTPIHQLFLLCSSDALYTYRYEAETQWSWCRCA